MEGRGFLVTYEVTNITDHDIFFEVELNSGIVVEQMLMEGTTIRGLNRHARNLLTPWEKMGWIVVKEEERRPNWREEGF